MSDSLPDWPRQFYEQGEQKPFLFYVVFGSDIKNLKLSRSLHRCDEIPAGIGVSSYNGAAHGEAIDSFREGYLWDELVKTNPALAATVSAQNNCIVVQGSVANDNTLDYFRNVIGLMAGFMDCGGVAIYDPQRFKWWSKEEWTSTVFAPAAPLPREHVLILFSVESDDTEWFHTRGLRKFGRPDLSIHGVTRERREAIIDLFNRFIEYQAFGGIIKESQEIRVKGLPPGMFCRHQGNEDDPDFNNYHVEISWPKP